MFSPAAVLFLLAVTSALPHDPILRKLDPVRFQYMWGGGQAHLVDLWMTAGDLEEAARFTPDLENVYHLFTRANPTVSQPLLNNAGGLLRLSNYDPNKRTVVLIHGWLNEVVSEVNAVLIPAFLAAADVNVIAVDWSAGAGTNNYAVAVINTSTSGVSVARFINWLNAATGSTPAQFHIVGHSLGGHQAGIVGRNVVGDIDYITALDPAFPGWITNSNRFRSDDGAYTEVIHTDAGRSGFLSTLGQVDFYPNGGINMPGCDGQNCDHARCFYYMGESVLSGGFTGRRCESYLSAMTGRCTLADDADTLPMGGTAPKHGFSGVYYLETDAAPPFSRG